MTPEDFTYEMKRMNIQIEAFKELTGIDFVLIGFVPDKLKGLKEGEMSPVCLGVTSTLEDEQVNLLIKSLALSKNK